ncbi:DUF3632 domain-containing protein [Aspergillus stella-maris]|uniref:DUF3632 domain-containing protein n=1 Tax=Aspergillus stella-maris TaxID=1810926 RepID=UPI003CCD535B
MSTPPLNLQLNGHRGQASGTYSPEAAYSILQQYLLPDEEDEGLSLETAFRSLNGMAYFPEPPTKNPAFETPRERSLRKSHSVVMDMSHLLIHVARQIPYHHPAQDKLVKLIVRLSQSKHFIFTGSFTGHTRMAYLMEELAEQNYHIFPLDNSRCCSTSRQLVNTRALNLSAFSARLQSAGLDSSFPSDILWAMSEFEEELDADANYDPALLSARIIAASTWILFAGDYNYRAVVLAPALVTPDLERIHRGGGLYTGPVLGLERWMFWVRRLDEVSRLAGVSGEAHERGQEAVGVMKALAESG